MSKKTIFIAVILTMCITLYAQASNALGVLDLNLFVTPYYCNVDTGIHGGTLYSTALSNCQITSDTVFTGFVCTYEGIIGDVFGDLLCGFMHSMQSAFWAMMTLFITFVGVMILTGQLPFTARDGVFTILKIALIIGFATDPAILVSILFKGLFAALQEGMFMVLMPTSLVTHSLPLTGLLGQMDDLIAEFINHSTTQAAGNNSPCSGGALTMMLSFMASMPPLAMIAITMIFKLFMVFARAILGYLLSITGIMFLITVAPIFLSLALFTITRSLFDRWLKFLISFVIQIVVVFAFIGFVITLDLGKDFREIFNLSAPYSMTNWVESVRLPQNICTFCSGAVANKTIVNANGTTSVVKQYQCANAANPKGMAPFEMVQNKDFVSWISTKFIYLLFVSYLLSAILTAAPSIARHLSGAAYAPTLGGVPIDNQDTAIADISVLGSVGRNFSSGFGRVSGGLNTKIIGGVKQAKNAAIGGNGGRSGITEIIRSGLGLK